MFTLEYVKKSGNIFPNFQFLSKDSDTEKHFSLETWVRIERNKEHYFVLVSFRSKHDVIDIPNQIALTKVIKDITQYFFSHVYEIMLLFKVDKMENSFQNEFVVKDHDDLRTNEEILISKLKFKYMSQVKNYRKKPVEIQAIEYTGELGPVKEFLGIDDAQYDRETRELIIPTLEDGSKDQVKHVASVGDFIIKGLHGEFYPCKPEIFHKSYELITPTV